ncbi:DoxX family protein [Geobacillus stearothermophilus]|uniref:DoxX family protein n=1 Tax=Geobacillus stearothermophilus TaxID=1422 RepID=UPI0030B902A1
MAQAPVPIGVCRYSKTGRQNQTILQFSWPSSSTFDALPLHCNPSLVKWRTKGMRRPHPHTLYYHAVGTRRENLMHSQEFGAFLLRIVTGFIFFAHGWVKWQRGLEAAADSFAAMGLGLGTRPIAAAFEPALGSVKAKAPIHSPVAIFGK